MSLRRGIVWASTGQYLTLAVNFSATLLLARVLIPFEFGVAALGIALIGLAEALREIAGGTYLIREPELDEDKIRTTATLNFLLSLALAAGILLIAEPAAWFFAAPGLASYLHIAVVGFMVGPLLYPQQALLSRSMAFKRLALVNVVGALGGAATAIAFGLAGYGSNSFAWGGVASAVIGTVAVLFVGRGPSMYRPTVSRWRDVLSFGLLSSTTAVVGRLAEALPLLIFGRLLGASELAIGHRAVLLCLMPERLISAVAGHVALPELARLSRDGGDLGRAFLMALGNITALHWPALGVLAVLAEPAVMVLLGGQWLAAAPLVQVLSLAFVAGTPLILQYPVLVAAGGIRLLPPLLAFQAMVTTCALALTAGHGLSAAALGMLVAMPISAGASLLTIRLRVGFAARELAGALVRSAAVTAVSVAGPLILSLWRGGFSDLGTIALAVFLAGFGWLIALRASGHPLWSEIVRATAAVVALRGSPPG